MVLMLQPGGKRFLSLFTKSAVLTQHSGRAAVFTALASSGIMPVAHVAFMEGGEGLAKLPLLNIAITCASYTIGTAVYVYRVPEKPFPGIFDLWVSIYKFYSLRLVVVVQLLY